MAAVLQAASHSEVRGDAVKKVVILPLLLFIQMLGNPSWIYYKGSPERTGAIDVPAPDTRYLLWKVNTESELYSSPVVKNGRVFQVAFEKIICIDLDTGEILWTSPVPAYHSTPALSHDTIIVATNRGISALSAETGGVVWEYKVSGRFSKRFSLKDYIVSSPVVHDGRVVVGTRAYQFLMADGSWFLQRDDLNVVCLDEDTGREKWYIETTLGVLSSPCAVHGKVFAASREMLCIDLVTGEIVWNSEDRYPYDSDKPKDERYAFDYSTPALYHGLLAAGSCVMGWDTTEQRYLGFQKIVAIDQYTGDIFWEWRKEGAMASSPIIYGGKIYFYSYDGMVRCLSLLGGEEMWETPISDPREYESKGFRLWPSPAATDGKVYIGSVDGVFYCLDSCTGEVLWTYETGGPTHSSPAIVSGKVLVSSGESLYCFSIDPETYILKARKYIDGKTFDLAAEFLLKAEEYAKTGEEAEEIDTLLERTIPEIPTYRAHREKSAKAEALIDEVDRIIWNRDFKGAENCYREARTIYEELKDEFGVSFCQDRIIYIQKRMLEREEPHYYGNLLILICGLVTIFILVLKKILKR